MTQNANFSLLKHTKQLLSCDTTAGIEVSFRTDGRKTDGRTDGRTEGQTDVEVEIVI